MNKKRMGEFLRKLRNNKKWSQEKLSKQFREKYFDVSIKTISDWENGKTIPEIDKLSFLSKIYEISIDEILDGEVRKKVDYYDEYLLANKDWDRKVSIEDDIHTIYQEHKFKVCKRFKKLMIDMLNDDFTRNDEEEFRFLFEHFYKLSEYAEEHVDHNINDDYLKFIEAIKNKLLEIGDANIDEKYFEVSKLFSSTEKSCVSLKEIVNGVNPNSYLDKRFKSLDWWEKDMLLMSIQKGEIVFDESRYGSGNLEIYKQRHGKEFDKEDSVRTAIKYMIDNGACLNHQFINILLKKHEKQRIIDRVEELYLLCEKPIPCSYMDDDKTFTRYAENNRRNRFIDNYYYQFKSDFDFLKLDINELYDFIWKYDPISVSDELVIYLANELKIDTKRDINYVRADLNIYSYLFNTWKEYRLKEKEIETCLVELKRLEDKIQNGENYEIVIREEYIGGSDFDTMMEYFEYWKSSVSLCELKKQRDKGKTKELLANLSSYTLDDIRSIYLKEEVREDGVINE